VESQAFLGVGKHGLSRGQIHKVPRRLLRESGHWRTLGVTANCGQRLVYAAEGGHQEAGAGFGAARPEAEAAVGYLSEWRTESILNNGHWRGDSGGQCGKQGGTCVWESGER
jgi:hypothetical protein